MKSKSWVVGIVGVVLIFALSNCSKRGIGIRTTGRVTPPAAEPVKTQPKDRAKRTEPAPKEGVTYTKHSVADAEVERFYFGNVDIGGNLKSTLKDLMGTEENYNEFRRKTCIQSVRYVYTYRDGKKINNWVTEFQDLPCPSSGIQTDQSKIVFARPEEWNDAVDETRGYVVNNRNSLRLGEYEYDPYSGEVTLTELCTSSAYENNCFFLPTVRSWVGDTAFSVEGESP